MSTIKIRYDIGTGTIGSMRWPKPERIEFGRMISILIAGTLLGQWKGWDGAAGKPLPKAGVKVTRIERPGGLLPQAAMDTMIEPAEPKPAAFEPVPVAQRTTSDLVVRLASLRERAAELAADLERNATNYRRVPVLHTTRGKMRSAPMATPMAQAARYMSLHKRMRHQLILVAAEIAQIERELIRRGVDV